MTFNIRYDNPGDGVHAWPSRIDRVASTIRFNGADLVGVQEALHHQLEDPTRALPEYSWLGVGRDDGQQAGEYTAIFYRTDEFEVLDSGTFWLSKTPEVPGSKDWDAAITRITTWARFNAATGEDFYFFNTHFDHIGEEARTNSSALIIDRMNEIAPTSPAILVGDFNADPSTQAYQTITRSLSDAMLSSETPHHGPEDTRYGFEVTGEPGTRIDYIFVNDYVDVLRHGTLSDSWNGAFASDHLAVLAEVEIGTRN
ncbi:MAG: endonuclease/exonuclease/phosphatase family protein [Rhodothermales bacterium]|nr:endonuclease/exonuclease/phosphatase family protein [Rhodothermales bacterium]